MNTTAPPTDHTDLPYRAKYVHLALETHDEPLTRQELETVCDMAERTVNDALALLQDAGLVERADNPDLPSTKPRYGAVRKDLRGRGD